VSKGEWRNNYIFPAIENPSNLNRIHFVDYVFSADPISLISCWKIHLIF